MLVIFSIYISATATAGQHTVGVGWIVSGRWYSLVLGAAVLV